MTTLKKISSILGLFVGLCLVALLYYNIESSQKNLTAIVIAKTSLDHDKLGHPESSQRLKSIIKQLNENGLMNRVQRFPERLAEKQELHLVHQPSYVESVFNWPKSGRSYFNNDEKWSPYFSPKAVESARSAVGSLIDLTEAVALRKAKNGFAIIRPPGHHATADRAMGFCIFNNVAVAAENLLQKGLAKKILIVDTDAHYGNGIADIFKNNPQVYYISHNQQWMFPYTDGTSTDHIKDFKIKFLLNEPEHLDLFKKNVTQAFDEFQPDFVLVAAGYDAHWRDYMSNLSLTLKGYAEISRFLISLSEGTAQGKIVFSLEGGYDLDVLSLAVSNTVRALIGDPLVEDPYGTYTLKK